MLNWLKRRLQSYRSEEREETWTLDLPWGDETLERKLFVAIHPARASRIVVMIPGCDGTLAGYERKYAKLASYLVEAGLGAVVRTGNPMLPGLPYESVCQTNLRGVVDGALERSREICGEAAPELLLVGWSAGASAIAAQAAQIPQVTGILLFAPSGDAGEADLRAGLERYEGELFVVAAADDAVVQDLPRSRGPGLGPDRPRPGRPPQGVRLDPRLRPPVQRRPQRTNHEPGPALGLRGT